MSGTSPQPTVFILDSCAGLAQGEVRAMSGTTKRDRDADEAPFCAARRPVWGPTPKSTMGSIAALVFRHEILEIPGALVGKGPAADPLAVFRQVAMTMCQRPSRESSDLEPVTRQRMPPFGILKRPQMLDNAFARTILYRRRHHDV